MKKCILLLFVLPFTLFSQSQRKKEKQIIRDTIHKIIYGKDVFTKDSKYSATDIVEQGKMFQNQKEGTWISYFNNGKQKLIAEYKKGEPNGKFFKFYENGKLREKGVFIDNHYSDTLFRYYQNGNIESITIYNDKGEENGINTYFHENGNMALTYERENNKIENLITWYKEDGILKHQLQFSKSGRIKPLFENESSFAFENIVGKKTVFSLRVAGPITKDHPFNPNGFNIVYTKYDEVYQVGEFSNGSLIDGKSFQYDDDGLLDKILVYKSGKFISYAQINKK